MGNNRIVFSENACECYETPLETRTKEKNEKKKTEKTDFNWWNEKNAENCGKFLFTLLWSAIVLFIKIEYFRRISKNLNYVILKMKRVEFKMADSLFASNEKMKYSTNY